MERLEIDGVTVVWRHGPGQRRAMLAFAVGIRDETLDSLGVTDAVAALAGAGHDMLDKTVDVDVTTFDLTGPPGRIVAGLAGLCAALADPPIDRLATVGDDAADDRTAEPGTVGTLLLHRYGPRGPGLARWETPRYAALTPETVLRYADEYFVAGNAVLILNGPPPGLRLPLRHGPRPERPMVWPVSPDRPQWFTAPGAEVCVTLRGGRGLRRWLAADVLHQRLLRAVQDAALRYDVQRWDIDVDPRTSEMQFTLAPAQRRAAQPQRAAELLWREVRRLAADPATAEELTAAQARLADPPDSDDLLDDADVLNAVLHDLPVPAGTVSLADLHELAAAWSQSALLVVPGNVRPDLPGMHHHEHVCGGAVPHGKVYRRPLLHRLVNAGSRAERLVVGDDSISRVDATGLVHTIRFTDIVVVEECYNARVVHGRDGCVVDVDPERFPRVRRVVRMLDRRVPLSRRPIT